ncbi:MAG TPA: hypothetical protein VIF14_13670 [Alphaproteobacteria bacterium]|jgi:hypothetical protein
MLVQLYEIGSPEEGRAVAALGIDHVGVLVGGGAFSRERAAAEARAIFAALPPRAKRVALSLAAAVGPAGVDSKTKTDRDSGHARDLEKARAFVQAAKRRSC